MIRAIVTVAARAAAACLAALILLTGCASTDTATSSSTPVVCLSNAPGGRLCRDDARSFCQEMKTGQTVDPSSIDATTRQQCAQLGVTGLR